MVECWWSARRVRLWRSAREAAYEAAGEIKIAGAHYRKDIGAKGGETISELKSGRGDTVATGTKAPAVGIVMGSDTDFPVMSEAGKTLAKFGIRVRDGSSFRASHSGARSRICDHGA